MEKRQKKNGKEAEEECKGIAGEEEERETRKKVSMNNTCHQKTTVFLDTITSKEFILTTNI